MAVEYEERLSRTLPGVRERIARAAALAGRPPGCVRLVAVTKGHPVEAVRAAVASGLRDLGENRVSELETKVSALGGEGVTWHMIGHLQSRKAAAAVELAEVVHSVDSVRLANRLSRIATGRRTEVRIFAQVNTSGEASKSGFRPAEALDEIPRIAELPGLHLEGLMTMAPFVDQEPVVATAFRRLRELSETLRGVSDQVGPELSMGMSNDLEIAIREGSTLVRIGTALFGERVT